MFLNITLLVLFYILKAVADKISFHFYDSIFYKLPKKCHDYWNPAESWDNKWLDNDKDNGERFYGSSTVFVMFTDAYHLIKFIQYVIISLLIVLNAKPIFHPVIDFPIYLFGGLIIFELFFSKVFKKR
jgi:hypothetical protein